MVLSFIDAYFITSTIPNDTEPPKYPNLIALIWTANGLRLDDFELEQTFRSATDTANNAYVEGISNKDWVDDTLMRLRGENWRKNHLRIKIAFEACRRLSTFLSRLDHYPAV